MVATSMLKKLFFTGCLLLASILSFGHPLPGTKVSILSDNDVLKCIAVMPVAELEVAIKQQIDIHSKETEFLKTYFAQHIKTNKDGDEWGVEIGDIEFFSSDDSKMGGHHGAINFLRLHFTMIPVNKSQINSFTFDYDVILHEVVTHKISVYQSSADGKDSHLLGVIGMNISTGKITPINIELKPVTSSFSSLLIILGVISALIIGFIILRMVKLKNTN